MSGGFDDFDGNAIDEAFDLFDDSNYKDAGFQPIPAGKYMAVVESAEFKANSKGTGSLIKCKVQIAGGEYDGRIVWDNINVAHEKQRTANIGRQHLARFFKAVKHTPSYGTDWARYAADMPDKPVGIEVIVKGDQNEIENYVPAF